MAGVRVDVRVGAPVVVAIGGGMAAEVRCHVGSVGASVTSHVIVPPGLLATEHCPCAHSCQQNLLEHGISPFIMRTELFVIVRQGRKRRKAEKRTQDFGFSCKMTASVRNGMLELGKHA